MYSTGRQQVIDLPNVQAAGLFHRYDFDCTQIAIPPSTRAIPSHVSRAITFLSTYHSPRTVKRNALEFARGTVKESSARLLAASVLLICFAEGGHTMLSNQEKKPNASCQVDY
jgi:hypothetical protein